MRGRFFFLGGNKRYSGNRLCVKIGLKRRNCCCCCWSGIRWRWVVVVTSHLIKFVGELTEQFYVAAVARCVFHPFSLSGPVAQVECRAVIFLICFTVTVTARKCPYCFAANILATFRLTVRPHHFRGASYLIRLQAHKYHVFFPLFPFLLWDSSLS